MTRILFTLLVLTFLTSCNRVIPAGFWKNYKDDLIKEDISDQGPWGGYRSMLWESHEQGQFTSNEIVEFATNNGWTFVRRTKFVGAEIEQWTYDRKMIFPLSDRGFNSKPKDNNHTYSSFPRWITGDIELLEFKTGWMIVAPGTGKASPAYGYVIINNDKSKMSVYHLWGE